MTISITSPTSTTSKIQQNGNDVLTVDSSNNVTVINNLSVSGTVSSTGAITFDGGVSGDVNFDSGTLYVDATNNRVGIGTSSPSVKFQVSDGGASSNATIKIHNTANANTNYGCAIQFTNQNTTYYMGQIAALRTNSAVNYSSYLTFSYSANTTITEGMRLTSNGNLRIGCTSSPNASITGVEFVPVLTSDWCKFSAGSTGGIRAIGFYNPNGLVGDITTNGSGTLFNTSSDYRLKENNVNITDGISRVKLLKPYRFNFIADASVTVDGFFAHEVQDVVPEAITKTKDAMRTEEYEVTPAVLDDNGNVVTEAVMGTREVPDYQGIDQSKLVPLLTAALQEAITKIEDLETRIQALEGN